MGPGELIRGSALVVLAIVGCSVVVLTGWSGQVSLGQMSFAAVGATVGAVALLDWHWDLSLALLLAGAAAAAVAVVVGIPTLRLDGMFAAVTTLAFALAASGYLLVREEFSWIPQGQLGVPYLFGLAITSQTAVFELCLGVLVLVLVALHGLRHSRTGRVLRALPGQPAGGVGLRRPRPVGQADRLRRLGLHRRPGRLPPARGQPVVPGDLVPGARQPGRVHLDRRGRARLGPRRRSSAPPSSRAAPSTCRRAGSCSPPRLGVLLVLILFPAGWPASATTCATGRSTAGRRRRRAATPGVTGTPSSRLLAP